MHTPEPIYVVDRGTGTTVVENVLGDRLLRAAYGPIGRSWSRTLLFRTGWASRLLGTYCNTRWSRRKIARTIRDLGIDTSEMRDPVSSFATFNAFFRRHLRAGVRPFDGSVDVLVSPADCRMLVYASINVDRCVSVKGMPFTLPRLLDVPADACEAFHGGAVAVARLCPADYHRYHFPAAGRVLSRRHVRGRYDSVNPLALAAGVRVFEENVRVVNELELDVFGATMFVEVGAFGVAAIVETHGDGEFDKMAEKGYFEFGGSSIVLVFRRNCVQFCTDLVDNSARGLETLVKAGETIGRG